jgi:hypothetical protein
MRDKRRRRHVGAALLLRRRVLPLLRVGNSLVTRRHVLHTRFSTVTYNCNHTRFAKI